ncbi:hypothetical protein L6452_20006 [Arctium lappa]|uniref:Uncharacterized protein n=1 Tax=Arctium lappa TaxID=4217 RepID=A0ACB9BAY6_ARCLA|nr:hypothetical protein L6452_20006 [Arctium lappa]
MAREFSRLLSLHVFIVLWCLGTFVVSFAPQVPCYFIFGDSLVDSGNNNELVTKAKANYRPYGIDFPQGITGRFTNGQTMADIIGQFLGFREFIPPYATATDKQISTGVNYGSGSAGIREESGSHLGDRISLDRQLLHHKSTISRLSRSQRKTLKKCIYIVNIGSNDYINNYLLYDIYNTSQIYSTDQYAEVLIQQYSRQLRTLYRLGGRKVVVFGLTKIGCTPNEMNKFGTDGKPCVESINNAIKLFNDRLMPLVDELNNNNTDARFTFINLTSILSPLGDVPFPSTPCCHVREDWQCVPNSIPCMIRTLSIFYDGFHPSEISNIIIATRSYVGVLPMDASPYDISQLARL